MAKKNKKSALVVPVVPAIGVIEIDSCYAPDDGSVSGHEFYVSESDTGDDVRGEADVPVVAKMIDEIDPETAEVTQVVLVPEVAQNSETMKKLPLNRALGIAKEAIERLPKSLRGKYRAWLWDAENSGVVTWVFAVTNCANVENLRRIQVEVDEAAELTQKNWPTDLFTAKFLTPREKRTTGWLPYIKAQIATEVNKWVDLQIIEPTADSETQLFIVNPKDREDMNRAIVNGIALWKALDDRAPYGRCHTHGEPRLSADGPKCQKCLKEKPTSQAAKFEEKVAKALQGEDGDNGKGQSKNQRWQFGKASTGKHRKK